MPSQHKYSPITPRLPTELKYRAQRAVAEMGTDLSSLVTSLLRWYVGDLNELPPRPGSANREERKPVMQSMVECKLCHAELQVHPSYANRTNDPITTYRHRIEDFPRAYGRNVDSGNDVRADNCGMYGVNTGSKLAEHGLSFGWIDDQTGVRLCCNEEPERRYSCARERFHEGDHKDAVGNLWHQRSHFLLTRIEPDGCSGRHLDLYDSQANAEVAASYDIGGKKLEWLPRSGSFQYEGALSGRLAYVISFIDISRVREYLENVPTVIFQSG
jgi:hypothetical protein